MSKLLLFEGIGNGYSLLFVEMLELALVVAEADQALSALQIAMTSQALRSPSIKASGHVTSVRFDRLARYDSIIPRNSEVRGQPSVTAHAHCRTYFAPTTA